MGEQVKDLALSWHRLESLLWCRFDIWLGNFHMPGVRPKKKKKDLVMEEVGVAWSRGGPGRGCVTCPSSGEELDLFLGAPRAELLGR